MLAWRLGPQTTLGQCLAVHSVAMDSTDPPVHDVVLFLRIRGSRTISALLGSVTSHWPALPNSHKFGHGAQSSKCPIQK